jgi:hypothetical protein
MSAGATVAAVVPCRDEAPTLAACLASIRAQEPAVSCLVVVDNGSTDGSLEIARRQADVVLPGHGSIGALRNQGAAVVPHADALVFVDADVELDPRWLTVALRELDSADLVGSRSLADPSASWVARRWAAIEAAQTHPQSLVWSQHLAIRGETFRRLGGFDETLPTGEDGDLSSRVRAAGGTVRLVEEMIAVHHGFPGAVGGFLRRERWHTASTGWFRAMSAKSRGLVLGTAAWGVLGAASVVVSASSRRPGPTVGWAAATVAAVPALGLAAGSSPRHAVQDGVLTAMWAGLRAWRLPQEVRL